MNRYDIRKRNDAFRDGLVLPEPNVIVLKLWEIPSFSPPVGWVVFYKHWSFLKHKDSPISNPFVKKFHFTSRYEGGYYSIHTVKTQEAPIPETELTNLWQTASQVSITPILVIDKLSGGLDGTSFGFELPGYGFAGFCIYWWGEGPREWEPITTWFHSFRELLDKHINDV
jgi:hypothetical protein